jgi:hypothetical protein
MRLAAVENERPGVAVPGRLSRIGNTTSTSIVADRSGASPLEPVSRHRVPVIGPTHVQVPDDLPPVTDAGLTLWAVYAWRTGDGDECWPGQERLQRDLGREGSDPRHLRALVAELDAVGLVDVSRRYYLGKTNNRYRPLRRTRKGDGRRYVALPAALLVAVAAGEAGPEHIAAAVRWLRECRKRGGWVTVGVAEMAKEWGQSVSTVRRHRSLLVALGVLDERQRPGLTPLTAAPGRLPAAVVEPVSGRGEATEPRSQITGHPGHQSPVTPVTDHRQNYPEKNYPEENYQASVPVGTDVAAVDAHAHESAASPRVEISSRPNGERAARGRSAVPSPAALGVLALLPRAWRSCEPWVRRRLAARLERAMAAYGAAAIGRAVDRYAPEPGGLADTAQAGGKVRHLWALDRVLTLLAGDVKGGAYPDCGHERDTATGAHRCGVFTAEWWVAYRLRRLRGV